YCVPLEHYNTLNLDALDMGMYGMVRNHFYQVTTGDIKTLGKGIYDPDEIIVPGDKVQMWYLAAKININAWHIVKQTTDLAE
ncbi:MAG: fimbria major subunit, partial [Bacteroidales bacterium]|nr:fimbria major subunit [Bacteroidales bacterium]